MTNQDMMVFSAEQSRVMVNASHHYEQYLQIEREREKAPAWMSWRPSGGKNYLRQADRKGNRTSLGVESAETLKIFEDFERKNAALKQQREDINAKLSEQAAIMKALRMSRMPSAFAKVIRAYDVHGVLGNYLWVAGTHAIYAYESLSAHWLDSSLAATEDLDFVWSETKSEIVAVNPPPRNLLGTLKAIDNTFTVNTENRFQVRNSKGLMIDFITTINGENTTPVETLKPIGIHGQEWLQLLPPVSATVIDTNGLPVRLVAPHPALFALHKLWISTMPERNRLKVAKDKAQAMAVIDLITNAMPQFAFTNEFVELLPAELKEIYEDLGIESSPLLSAPDM
ncbi:MAG: hypothetical protein KAG18_05885 [Sinobacterium sp.]|nr:hypothetical protein [Sinobacterium sp.]